MVCSFKFFRVAFLVNGSYICAFARVKEVEYLVSNRIALYSSSKLRLPESSLLYNELGFYTIQSWRFVVCRLSVAEFNSAKSQAVDLVV